jgi:hypothetical protein
MIFYFILLNRATLTAFTKLPPWFTSYSISQRLVGSSSFVTHLSHSRYFAKWRVIQAMDPIAAAQS